MEQLLPLSPAPRGWLAELPSTVSRSWPGAGRDAPQAGKGAGAEPGAGRELILLSLGRTAWGALVSEQGWGGTLSPVAAVCQG